MGGPLSGSYSVQPWALAFPSGCLLSCCAVRSHGFRTSLGGYPFTLLLAVALCLAPLLGAACGCLVALCHCLPRGSVVALTGVVIDHVTVERPWAYSIALVACSISYARCCGVRVWPPISGPLPGSGWATDQWPVMGVVAGFWRFSRYSLAAKEPGQARTVGDGVWERGVRVVCGCVWGRAECRRPVGSVVGRCVGVPSPSPFVVTSRCCHY